MTASRVVTFRVTPEVHEELSQAAKAKGIDLSSMLNQVIAEALPSIRAGVVDLERRAAASRLRVKEEHLDLVWVAYEAGKHLDDFVKMSETMKTAIRMFGRLDPLTEQEIVLAACREVLK